MGGRGGRSGISKPRNLRGFRDASGQLVFDPDDENLSDKELYARNIPAIGSELEQYSDEDYEYGRGTGGRRGDSYQNRRKRRGGRQERIFVALFDYDPPTMSPNPEACDEELPFREGQLIKVIGDKDADGFYWGECGKRSGYVPCNMVSEVQVEDERMLQDIFKEDRRGLGGRGGGGYGGPGGRERWGDIYANTPVKKMIALYDYDPQELSPNVDLEVELPFRTGDVIYVYGDMDDDGFYLAELRGQRGLVPSNFLSEVPNQGRQALGPTAVGGVVRPPGVQAGVAGAVPTTTTAATGIAAGVGSALTGGLGSLFGGKKEATTTVTQPAHVTAPAYTTAAAAPYAAQPHTAVPAAHAAAPVAPQPAAAAAGPVGLDCIPGLDDEPVAAAPLPTAKPAAAAKPATSEAGGLLGGITGGLTSGIGNLTGAAGGATGKLGDVASGAAGGAMKAAGGLFKKFGF